MKPLFLFTSFILLFSIYSPNYLHAQSFDLLKVHELEFQEFRKFTQEFRDGLYDDQLDTLSPQAFKQWYKDLGGLESLNYEGEVTIEKIQEIYQRWDYLLIMGAGFKRTLALRMKMEESEIQPYPFSLRDTDGKVWSMEELRGKPVFLNFFFVACSPCKEELPYIKRLYEKYKDKVTFIGLSHLDTEARLKGAKERFAVDFPLIPVFDVVSQSPTSRGWNSNEFVFTRYGVHAVPVNVLINHEGKIVNPLGRLTEDTYQQYEATIEQAIVAAQKLD